MSAINTNSCMPVIQGITPAIDRLIIMNNFIQILKQNGADIAPTCQTKVIDISIEDLLTKLDRAVNNNTEKPAQDIIDCYNETLDMHKHNGKVIELPVYTKVLSEDGIAGKMISVLEWIFNNQYYKLTIGNIDFDPQLTKLSVQADGEIIDSNGSCKTLDQNEIDGEYEAVLYTHRTAATEPIREESHKAIASNLWNIVCNTPADAGLHKVDKTAFRHIA